MATLKDALYLVKFVSVFIIILAIVFFTGVSW